MSDLIEQTLKDRTTEGLPCIEAVGTSAGTIALPYEPSLETLGTTRNALRVGAGANIATRRVWGSPSRIQLATLNNGTLPAIVSQKCTEEMSWSCCETMKAHGKIGEGGRSGRSGRRLIEVGGSNQASVPVLYNLAATTSHINDARAENCLLHGKVLFVEPKEPPDFRHIFGAGLNMGHTRWRRRKRA